MRATTQPRVAPTRPSVAVPVGEGMDVWGGRGEGGPAVPSRRMRLKKTRVLWVPRALVAVGHSAQLARRGHHNARLGGRGSVRRPPSLHHTRTASLPRPSVATTVAAAAAAALLALTPTPASAANVRLPPIDSDPARCERAFVGNTIGQANAVSDKLLDLRACKLVKADLSGKTLSGALLVDADLSGAVLRETVLTKAYAVNANFTGADATNAVVDRVSFDKSNLTKVNFTNAILTG